MSSEMTWGCLASQYGWSVLELQAGHSVSVWARWEKPVWAVPSGAARPSCAACRGSGAHQGGSAAVSILWHSEAFCWDERFLSWALWYVLCEKEKKSLRQLGNIYWRLGGFPSLVLTSLEGEVEGRLPSIFLFIQAVSESNLKLIFSQTVINCIFIHVTTLSHFLISIPFLLPVILTGTFCFYCKMSFKFGIFHANKIWMYGSC